MKKYFVTGKDGCIWMIKDRGLTIDAYCGKRAITGMSRREFKRRFLNEALR